MKLLLLIVLASFSFAATTYRIPVFTVEHNPLYCWQGIDNMQIITHKPGDLIDGEHALRYCSYNIDTTTEKYNAYINQNKLAPNYNRYYTINCYSMVYMDLVFLLTTTKSSQNKS
jgi:hypothetical protein